MFPMPLLFSSISHKILKIKNFMEGIRTPLHDHARKNKGWSDTQVVIRFTILQIIVNLCFIAFVL